MSLLATLVLASGALSPALQSDWPQTRAERTGYLETSHYEDVIQFCEAVVAKSKCASMSFIGVSSEGRKIPLVVASRPLVSSAHEAKVSGKPIIYIQANIHAGEIEGKEAAMHLLRKYCSESPGILDHVILLVNPIYNADGNEKFGPQSRNRPGQNGPESVGLRPNGQGLDLNRDAVKAESPEMRSALERIYLKWDPHVMMDLHTTDGTRHGYPLTYSAPLNPNTHPAILGLARDRILPKVRSECRAKFGLEMFDYGNAERRGDKTDWYTYGHEARYVTSYAGLRNRIGILSEAFVYLSFADRVKVTEQFVDSIVRYVAANPTEIMQAIKAADDGAARLAEGGRAKLGVRFDVASRGFEDVLMEKPADPAQPRRNGPVEELVRVRMEVFDRFKATKTARVPQGYAIPGSAAATLALLHRHGVEVSEAPENQRFLAEQFTIEKMQVASSPFQGHRLVTLDGRFGDREVRFAPGTKIVWMNQPLSILAFHLLEPESTDGMAAWGFLEGMLEEGKPYPIYKIRSRR